jgi:cytochrome c biogenesis protein CcdA
MIASVVLAIEGNFAYSFMLGILAAVNPCGFVLLPAYLLYFLGIDSANPAAQRAPIRRALLVSAAVSSGFMLVFLIIGTISRLFTQWIELNAKYAGLLIGVALVVMGLAMLAGWKPSFITPAIGGERDRSLRAMFIFGIAYAVASIGCTIGFLTTAIFGSIGLNGFASGVISIVLYGVGMGLLVSTLTVTLAVAQGGLLRVLKNGLRYMDKLAAGFIVLTGMYLTWYWYVAVSERSSAGNVTQNIEGWQSSVANFLQRQGAWRLGLVFIVVVGGAILVNQLRSRSSKSQ